MPPVKVRAASSTVSPDDHPIMHELVVGLISCDDWNSCIQYLYATLSDEDAGCPLAWSSVLGKVRSFLDYMLVQYKKKLGPTAMTCLNLAVNKEMSMEYHHEMEQDPCIFSQRLTPCVYRSQIHTPCVSTKRVHCNFTWWALDDTLGIEYPHASPYFVYEFQYSFIIKGVYVLGHLAQILKKISTQLGATNWLAFKQSSMWVEWLKKINCLCRVLFMSLSKL